MAKQTAIEAKIYNTFAGIPKNDSNSTKITPNKKADSTAPIPSTIKIVFGEEVILSIIGFNPIVIGLTFI